MARVESQSSSHTAFGPIRCRASPGVSFRSPHDSRKASEIESLVTFYTSVQQGTRQIEAKILDQLPKLCHTPCSSYARLAHEAMEFATQAWKLKPNIYFVPALVLHKHANFVILGTVGLTQMKTWSVKWPRPRDRVTLPRWRTRLCTNTWPWSFRTEA